MAHNLNDFVRLALAKGPYSAPQNAAEEAVVQTTIDLCERAGVWREEFEFQLQQAVPDYPLDVPENTRLVCVEWIEIGKRKYKAVPASLMCRCGGSSISIPDNKTVWIQPTPYPACPEYVKMQLWLAPLQESCDLPDHLWQEYSDVIANGAASRLLQLPKTEFTNQGLANRYFNLYEAGVTRAKNKRVMERTTGPLMMTGSYF